MQEVTSNVVLTEKNEIYVILQLSIAGSPGGFSDKVAQDIDVIFKL